MGNKSSTRALRLGISQHFDADWYADPKQFAKTLSEDMVIRSYLDKNLKQAGIARVVISRFRDAVELKITCLKPSYIVGRKGAEVDDTARKISALVGKEVRLKVFDIKRPELSAACLAKDIAYDLQKKGVSTRRIIKKYVQNARRSGALGVRIECSGRLSGAEIARTEWYQEGAVPRQKFRADIDYAQEASYSSWGLSGVKVWVYKADVVGKLSDYVDSSADRAGPRFDKRPSSFNNRRDRGDKEPKDIAKETIKEAIKENAQEEVNNA